MIVFAKELWRLFRAKGGNGFGLRWPWAVLAVAFVVCFYAVIAPFHWLAGWIGRRERCPQRLRRLGDMADGKASDVFLMNQNIVKSRR